MTESFTLGESTGATLGQTTGGILGPTPPNAPLNVSATVNAPDDVSLSWTDNSDDEDNFRIQINRNSQGWNDIVSSSTSATPGANTESVTIQPGSHGGGTRNTAEEVGADSEMQFRVRAENDIGGSDWAYSGSVYSKAKSPYNPSSSRTDGTSITISWTNQSSIEDGVEVQYREDTGSGYSAWSTIETTAAGTTSVSYDTANNAFMSTDARYQFRLRTIEPDGDSSLWAYADYGNQGNVYFEDDFESGDFSAWDSTNLSTNADVTGTLDSDFSDTAPAQGSYAAQLVSSDYIQENLGDLSGEADVIVRVYGQTASNDSSSEYGEVRWYDGSAWQTLETWGWGFDRTGWFTVTLLVPSSYLSTDNRIRLSHSQGDGSDWVAFDHVVVSDIVDEYTKPDAVSSLALDASVENEITASWTNNHAFDGTRDGSDMVIETWASDIDDSGVHSSDSINITSTSHTHTGLEDGEEYEVTVEVDIDQYRYGSLDGEYNNQTSSTIVTLLPAPTIDNIDTSTEDTITVDWTDNSDNEDGFYVHHLIGESWEDDSFSTWNTPNWNQVTDRVYEGSYAGYYKAADTDGILDFATKNIHPGGKQIDTFEYIWQETSYSHGGGISLVNSNGNEVFGMATDNPQWDIKDANGWRNVADTGQHDVWVKFTVEFDWTNTQCNIHFENLDGDDVYEESGIPLINGGDVERVEIKNYGSNSWNSSANFEMWVDAVQFGTTHDVSPNTETDTFSNARDGDRYLISVEAYTDDVRSRGERTPAVTYLPAASDLTIHDFIVERNDLFWNRQDDNPFGDFGIYRSTSSGSLGSNLSDETLSTERYNDLGANAGTTYYYTVRRQTEHTHSDVTGKANSAPAVPDTTTDMRWGVKNDWKEGNSYNIISMPTYDHNSHSIYLGIDPDEWSSLVAYYLFDHDSNTNTNVPDYSGENNDGTTYYWDGTNQAKVEDNTMDLGQAGVNGSDSWFIADADKEFVEPPNLGFHGDQAFSYFGVVKPVETTEKWGIFKFGRVDTGEVWSFQGQETGDAFVYGVNDTEETYVSVNEVYWDNWINVGTVYDPANNEKRLYYEGSKVDTTTISPVDLVDTRYRVGGYPWGPNESYASHTHWTNAYFATSAIFDKALTDSEMMKLMDSTYIGDIETLTRRLR